MEVGITDRQDPVQLCSLFYPPLYILLFVFLAVLGGKIRKIECEAKAVLQ